MPVGGGIGLARMAAISSPAFGLALTDVLFGAFILDALRQFGASKTISFIAIATGSVLSIFAAPFAGAFGGRSVRLRKYATLICFTVAASAALAVGVVAGDHSVSGSGPREESGTRVIILFALAALYRVSTQASPAVPMCIDAAHHKTLGEEETSLARIKVGVSWWYMWYRLGFLVANIVLASVPRRDVDGLMPFFISAAINFYLTLGLTAITMPSVSLQPKVSGSMDEEASASMPSPPHSPVPEPPRPRSAVKVALEDIKKVTIKGSPTLKLLFLETIFYGAAFGLLSVIVAPFYNEVIFGAPPGASIGIEWMAYSGLIAFAVGIIHDAVIGTLAFSCCSTWGMPLLWFSELLLGAGLFTSLYWIDDKMTALVVFGFLAVATSAQNFFSLVAAGALPDEPRLRPATFGMRASCLHIGSLIGTVVAAFLADGDDGFRPVMLLCAVALGMAAVCVVGIGGVEGTRFNDMPINANPLAWFLVKKDEKEFVRKVTGAA